jgi:hypothetical protein
VVGADGARDDAARLVRVVGTGVRDDGVPDCGVDSQHERQVTNPWGGSRPA